ncbi:MAG: hypothetical protein AB1486_13175 [Planctomycetota bacterium]
MSQRAIIPGRFTRVLALAAVGIGLPGIPGCRPAGSEGEGFLAYGFPGVGKDQRLHLETEVGVTIVHGDREVRLSMSWNLVVRLTTLPEPPVELPVEVPGEAPSGASSGGSGKRTLQVAIEQREITSAGSDEALAMAEGASHLALLSRGLARMLGELEAPLQMEDTGRLLEGDRAVFEVIFPLLPQLPVRYLRVGEAFDGMSRLLLPVVGEVEVTQGCRLVAIEPDAERAGLLVEVSLGGFEKDRAPRGTLAAPLELDTVTHRGHDRIRLAERTGQLVARDLSYEADARLKVRLGEGGVAVGPMRIKVRLDHRARWLR